MGHSIPASGLISRFILLSDIAGSSRLQEQCPTEFNSALDRHNTLFEQTVADCGGEIYKNTGDGYLAFFESAQECTACASELARAFAEFPELAEEVPFRVRIVTHHGELRPAGEEYFGPALNRASHVCKVCHPGQVLLSQAARPADSDLPAGTSVTDLGEHHLRDLAELEHLFHLKLDGLQQEFPALPTLGNRPNNLIEQPNVFIGRETELAELAELVADNRLISITAPGGYGKSRLAAQLCANLLEFFQRGVFYVELALIMNYKGIAAAIASAAGYQFFGRRDPEQQVIDYLRNKEMLLCCDNFEHVLEGAPFIADILKEAPGVKLVITSREPLKISGENVYRLQPLPIDAENSDAVMLFTDRATLANSGFALDLPVVQDICSQLSGIPMAIELAAAWMDTFTLTELREELSEQLELTARMSDVPVRQRSLRASLDWSWNLLAEEFRGILLAMSAFRGGCFADAAADVLSTKGMQLRAGLAKLIDKSWLYTRDIDGRTRFYLRDAASREYAFEKLKQTRDSGRAGSLYETTVLAHAGYYSALAAAEGPKLRTHGQLEALQLFRLELGNILEAKDTLVKRLDPVDSADLSRKSTELLRPIAQWLWVYLDMVSKHAELQEQYQALDAAINDIRLVDDSDPGTMSLRIYTLLGLVESHYRQGRYEAADESLSLILGLAETSDEPEHQAWALNRRGAVHKDQGRMAEARQCFEQAQDIFTENGNRNGEGFALHNQGIWNLMQGNLESACACYEQSFDIFRAVGNRRAEGVSLNSLGLLHYYRGIPGEAQKFLEAALAVGREIGDLSGQGITLNNLGMCHQQQNRLDESRKCFEEGLAIRREISDRSGEGSSLNSLGLLNHLQGRVDAALECYRESLAISREINDHRGEAFTLDSYAGLLLQRGILAEARNALERAEQLAAELNLIENLGCVHAKWARYHVAAGRERLEQAAVISEKETAGIPTEVIDAASESLAEAKAFSEQLGSTPDSDLGHEITHARNSIIEFAEDHGLLDSIAHLSD